jgi:glycine cleavage system transcriptional repressor
MDRYAILSAFGQDQIGIIANLSEVLAASNCNIEDSRITRMGQALTMMLLLKLPQGLDAGELLTRLGALKKELDLEVSVTELHPQAVVGEMPQKPLAHLTCHGADKIGIVHRITKFLSQQSINIIDMQTTVLRRAEPEYVMELTLELPGYTDIVKLGPELKNLGKALGVDVILRP